MGCPPASAQPPALDTWTAHRAEVLADPALIAYYDFQDGAGEVLTNHSPLGEALNGRVHDATWAEGRWPGKGALVFDGRRGHVQVPDHPALMPAGPGGPGSGELTVLVWLRQSSLKQGGIVDKTTRGTGVNGPYFLWSNPETVGYGGDGNPNSSRSTRSGGWDALSPEAAHDWMQVAFTVSATTLSLYRNGLLLGETPRGGLPANNGGPLLIGCMDHEDETGRFHFHGLMDEVALFGRALTGAEIRRNWRMMRGEDGAGNRIALDSPVGGERWEAGSQHRILWQATDESHDVRVEYSTDGGETWEVAAERVANEPVPGLAHHHRVHSQYLWVIPDTLSDRCRVRVLQVDSPEVMAQSAADFTIAQSRQVHDYRWRQVTPQAEFAARDGAGALVFQDRMWLIGGWNPGDKVYFPRICNNEVWSSEDGETWTLVRENSFGEGEFDPRADWEGRHSAGYVVHDDWMWIVGGDANQGHTQTDVRRSRDGDDWELVAETTPWAPRILHYTLVHDGKIWVMGGQTAAWIPGGEERFFSDVWSSEDGANWTLVNAEAPWEHRGMYCGHVVFGGRMWMISGGTYDTPRRRARLYFPEVWSSADGVDWERHVEVGPWAPRSYHNVEVFDDRMWILAGSNSQHLGGDRNDVWYSSDGVNWYELPDTPWAVRHAASVFVHQDALWMVAGAPGRNERSIWKLDRVAGQ